jgi:signal transduction histidine kinase/predicted hydrocarbon binding protein
MSIRHQAPLSEQSPGTLRLGGARMVLLDIESSFWALRRQMEALVGRRLTDAVLQQAGANGGAAFARAFARADLDSTSGSQALHDCVAAYQAAGFGQFEIDVLEWPIGRAVIRGTDTFEAWMMRQHEQKAEAPACAYTSGVLVGFVNALGGRQDVVCRKRACQAQGAEACLFELLPAREAAGTPIIAFDPDPFLSHQLNLLAILFSRMPMGIAIFDEEFVLRRFNPTWAGFIDRYTPSAVSKVVPGVHLFDLAPGFEATVTPVFQRVLTGETVQQEALRIESGGIVSYWDAVFSPLVEGGKVTGIVGVSIDATERVQADEMLRRTDRLAAMGRLAAALAHEINNPLQAIRSHLELVLDFDLEIEEREQYLQVCRQEIERLTEITQRVLSFARPEEDTRHPVSIADLTQRTLELVSKQLQQTNVQVTTSFPDHLPLIPVVPHQILQVLLNIVINATEVMEGGGLVQIEAREDDEMIALTLSNNGPPIPPEHIGRIFDPFFSTKPNGTGLGLSTSYSIVQGHGGDIRVENLSGGRGVCFTIRLPIVLPAEAHETGE